MIKQLAQNSFPVPTYGEIRGPSPIPANLTGDLGSFTSGILGVVFTAAAFIAFFYMFWGAFSYLLAGGDKGKIENAKKRITWAIIGLLVLSISFALSQFIQQVLTTPGFESPIGVTLVAPAYAATENLKDIYTFSKYNSIGDLFSQLTSAIFSIAGIILVFYFLYAAFLYITAGGGKDNIQKAQTMITHSIIGFVLLMMVYIVFQYILQFFGLNFKIF